MAMESWRFRAFRDTLNNTIPWICAFLSCPYPCPRGYISKYKWRRSNFGSCTICFQVRATCYSYGESSDYLFKSVRLCKIYQFLHRQLSVFISALLNWHEGSKQERSEKIGMILDIFRKIKNAEDVVDTSKTEAKKLPKLQNLIWFKFCNVKNLTFTYPLHFLFLLSE